MVIYHENFSVVIRERIIAIEHYLPHDDEQAIRCSVINPVNPWCVCKIVTRRSFNACADISSSGDVGYTSKPFEKLSPDLLQLPD